MTVQEQVAKMAYGLSDDNAIFLIDFMKKFMFPTNGRLSDDGYVDKKTDVKSNVNAANISDYMQELEDMRLRLKPCIPADFDPQKEWEQAMEEKYGYSG